MQFDLTRSTAAANGYSPSDLAAGCEYYKRKHRLAHPPGSFDQAGRFKAAERTAHVESVRAPSRRFPYAEMTAARSAKHVAELMGTLPIYVQRICRAMEIEAAAAVKTNHEALKLKGELRKILKPVGATPAGPQARSRQGALQT
jgi:hypothetical protein